METNKWLKELPEITAPCLIICATNWAGTWFYNLFEIEHWDEGALVVMQDGDYWGNIDELNADKFMIIEILKNEKQTCA